MIHRLLRAAIAVAAVSSFSPGQDGGSTTSQPPRIERPQSPKPKPAAEQAAREARERMTKFLAEHPELKERLLAQADANGDGKLDEVEKKRMHELLEQRMREAADRRGDRREERRDDRQGERRDDRRDERRDERRERADRNGDGRVGPAERERAQQVQGQPGCEHCREKPAAQPTEPPRGQTEPKPKPSPRPSRQG